MNDLISGLITPFSTSQLSIIIIVICSIVSILIKRKDDNNNKILDNVTLSLLEVKKNWYIYYLLFSKIEKLSLLLLRMKHLYQWNVNLQCYKCKPLKLKMMRVNAQNNWGG